MDLPVGVRPVTFLAVILGAALLVAGIQIVAWGGLAKYHYQVDPQPVGEDAVNETLAELPDSLDRSDVVAEYTNLSSQSQAIMREAVAADGRSVSRYGRGNGAPEIDIPGDVYGWSESEFYLSYRDAYYHLETAGNHGSLGMFDGIVSFYLGLAGAILWLVGSVVARNWRLSTSTLAGVGVVYLLPIVRLHSIGITGRVSMVAFGVAIAAASAVAAWYLAGNASRRIRAA